MNFDKMFPSNYLKASDLDSGPLTLRIDSVTMEKMGTGENKPVLFFRNESKGLVLNVTNGRVLAELYGDDTDKWSGKPVQLFATETEYQGRRTPCIRLRAPRPQAAEGGFRPVSEVIPPHIDAPGEPEVIDELDDI